MLSHTPVHQLSKNQRIWHLSFWYALVATLLLLAVIAIHYQLYVSSESARRADMELLNLEVGKTSIYSDISNIQSDVSFLARQAEQHGYFDSMNDMSQAILAQDFALFSDRKIIYDQIRLLDIEGQEIIRVNNNNGQAVIVDTADLQTKSKRYYYQEILQLQRDEIYLSPFDLNIEHGKIQIPLKPVIRFGTPVFNSKGGKVGVLILNYLGNRLLDNFRSATSNTAEHVMILNHEAYWLSHFNRDLEWGFMLDHDYTFATDFAQEWKIISTSPAGQFETDNGTFSYVTVFPGLEVTSVSKDLDSSMARPEFFNRPWSLVSHISIDEQNELSVNFIKSNLFFYLFLLLMFLVATHVIARLQSLRQMVEIEVEFEQHFRKVLESIELKVLAIDAHGVITFSNDALLALLGLKRDQLIGKNWLDTLVAKESKAECNTLFQQISGPSTCEYWMLGRTDSKYLVRWHQSFLKDINDEVIGLIFLGEDITHERENEIKVRHLSEAVEQSPVSVVLTNSLGIIEYVNPKFESVTGYNLDEIKGQNPRILKSGETSSADYSELWRTINQGGTWKGIFHNKKKNGELYWESASISGIRSLEGEITHFLAVKEDITEQKMLEERFQYCFNSAPVAMVMSDDEGRILLTNDHLQTLFGYSEEDLLGQDIKMLIPADAGYDRQNSVFPDAGKDYLASRKTGEAFPVEMGFSSAPSLQGELHIVAFIDLSARINLEKMLIQRNEEIVRNQALNKVGRMANMIAHDLRNPLSSIKMGLQISRKQPGNLTSENVLEINQIALDQVQYMEEILADMMSYSRPDAINLDWVDVSKVLEHCTSLVQKEIESTSAVVNTWYDKSLPLIHADTRKLQQVITNLLSNAIQSVESLDGVVPNISISVRLDDNHGIPLIRIMIEDNGCGIDAASVEDLFEPFYTRRAKGTGLGLAIARRFLELQQGSLELESGDSGGCSAIVRLKIDPEQ
ncbi:MAG: PAS domain S-box protein [Gammaproteobacteria bacterium]|nr:PAS domain S-box protein [Gammaproteobacteria bacterium]